MENTCKQCGTCCLKDGPALHIQDIPLIENDKIKKKNLLTLRTGEIVSNNVTGQLLPLEKEIIKIKGQNNKWTCAYYLTDKKICSIYEDRPLECQLLKCWDTKDIEAVYEKDRITRWSLVPENTALGELIKDHEKQCPVQKINELNTENSDNSQKEINRIIKYDHHFRQLLNEKFNLDFEEMDLYFGRSMDIINNMQKRIFIKQVCDNSSCKFSPCQKGYSKP